MAIATKTKSPISASEAKLTFFISVASRRAQDSASRQRLRSITKEVAQSLNVRHSYIQGPRHII
jgi:hypothetical protein